ncbi:MAG: GNAT family N-acetyltransferase, partial [Acidobacteriota bacterium]
KEHCIDILKSNVGTYMVAPEIDDYAGFLDGEAREEPYFVIFDGERAVACGGLAATADRVILTWGMVRHSLHGRGVGELLLEHRLRCAADKYGSMPVHIDTSQKTEGFYKKYGFETVKRVKDGHFPGIDQVLMVYRPLRGLPS